MTADDRRKYIKSVFETAVGPRLEDAKQVRLAHAIDHVFRHAAVELGLLGACAYELCDVARARHQFWHIRPGD